MARNSTFRLVSTTHALLRFSQPDRTGFGTWRGRMSETMTLDMGNTDKLMLFRREAQRLLGEGHAGAGRDVHPAAAGGVVELQRTDIGLPLNRCAGKFSSGKNKISFSR